MFFWKLFGYVFFITFALLLIVSIVRECAGQTPITFAYLLQSLENCPSIVIQPFSDLAIQGDWGLFDFMRSFLNVICYIMSYFVYLVTLILQVLVFSGYALTVLFGIAPNIVTT